VQYDIIFDVLLVQILLLWALRSCEGWVVQHQSWCCVDSRDYYVDLDSV
jgi:hypothetical protein